VDRVGRTSSIFTTEDTEITEENQIKFFWGEEDFFVYIFSSTAGARMLEGQTLKVRR